MCIRERWQEEYRGLDSGLVDWSSLNYFQLNMSKTFYSATKSNSSLASPKSPSAERIEYRWNGDWFPAYHSRQSSAPGSAAGWSGKKKELVVDFRRSTCTEHSGLCINGEEVERAESFKLFGGNISADLTWAINTFYQVREAQQRLYFLRKLKHAHLPQHLLVNFHRATTESLLIYCCTVWFARWMAEDRRVLRRALGAAEKITFYLHIYSSSFYSLSHIYSYLPFKLHCPLQICSLLPKRMLSCVLLFLIMFSQW